MNPISIFCGKVFKAKNQESAVNISTLPSGGCVAKFTVNIKDKFRKDKSGQYKISYFKSVEVWGKEAEFCRDLVEGNRVNIVAEEYTNFYTNKEGKEIEKTMYKAVQFENLDKVWSDPGETSSGKRSANGEPTMPDGSVVPF